MEKKKNMIVRISEKKLLRYKELCELNDYTMSKRIRRFVDGDIDLFEENEKVKSKLK